MPTDHCQVHEPFLPRTLRPCHLFRSFPQRSLKNKCRTAGSSILAIPVATTTGGIGSHPVVDSTPPPSIMLVSIGVPLTCWPPSCSQLGPLHVLCQAPPRPLPFPVQVGNMVDVPGIIDKTT